LNVGSNDFVKKMMCVGCVEAFKVCFELGGWRSE